MAKKEKKEFELLSVRIEKADKEKLEALAEDSDTTISQIVRRCVKTFILMEEKKKRNKRG